MNGDCGKIPSGAVYVATTGPETPTPTMDTMPEYVAINGVTEGAGGLSPVPPSAPPPEGGAQQTPVYPLAQLKQMLSQQLEYYFSR